MSSNSRPAKSQLITTSSGVLKRFSTRDDLVAWLVGQGLVQSEAELLGDPGREWVDMFHTWVQQGATGCVFAQRRSRDADAAQWLGVVMNTPPDDQEIDGLQEILEAASDAQAVLLAFPRALTLDDVGSLIAAFERHEGWLCEAVPRDESVELDDYAEIGVRWHLPHSRYRSEAIGFGPFEEFAVTRRAPVVAMALRTHPPTTKDDEGRVHLAQMPYDAKEAKRTDWFWERTRHQRTELLDGHLAHTARARVTFRLPIDVVTRYGIAGAASS